MNDGTVAASEPRKRRRGWNPVRKGAEFEREVVRRLRGLGWFVVRSAGSKTVVDIVALPPMSAPAEWKTTTLIQVKSHHRALSKSEVRAQLELSYRYGAVDVAHCYPGAEPGVVILKNLIGGAIYELSVPPDGDQPLRVVGDALKQ